jgi:transglutaminase-like putative cysteine protease
LASPSTFNTRPPARWAARPERMQKAWTLLFLLALFAMLSAAAGGVIAAGWLSGLEAIWWAAGVGLLAGAALAKSSFPTGIAHLTGLIYGFFTLGVIGTIHPDIAQQTADWHLRARALFEKVLAWSQAAASNGSSREPVILILVLSGLFWMLGYTAGWYFLRYRRVWHATLPTGVALLSNAYYYTGPNSMAPFLLAYLFCLVMMLALSHLADRSVNWPHGRVRLPRLLALWFVVSSVAIAAFAGLFGWQLSEFASSSAGRRFLDQLNQELLARWKRLFAVNNGGIAQNVNRYTESFTLSGPRNLTGEPVMDVFATPARYYWRAASYDYYDGLTWRNTIETLTNLQPLDKNIPLASYAERALVQADFVLYRGSDSVFTPSQPWATNLGAQAIFETTSANAVALVQLRTAAPLLAGNRYTAVGSLSRASAAQLRAAPEDYPNWVRARYLQLPPQVPDRVRNLAQNITAQAATAYDKAAAIERWMRRNIRYDEQIPAPPPGMEASDYVLFELRRAYCDYYATAMVAMLRSLGIPSRVAVGYAQGDVMLRPEGDGRAQYQVQADDSHTWVEVFFPEFGWIEFEPTANQPPIERTEPPQIQATPTAQPSLPPTPTPAPDVAPTPSPAPTDTAEPLLPADASEPPASLDQGLDLSRYSGLLYLLLIPFLVLAIWGGLRYAEEHGLSRLPAVERAYALITRYAGWLRVHQGRQLTPYEQAEALANRAPQARAPVEQITTLYVRRRFAPPDVTPPQTSDVAQALASARRVLRRALLRRYWPRPK